MKVVLRNYVGTYLDEKTIGEILEKVKETSVDWRQKLVEVPMARRRASDADLGLSDHTDGCTQVGAWWWARPSCDHREAAVGLSRLPRAVCESVGE